MILTINEKKILTAFGSPDLEDTINCLRIIATHTPVPETKKALYTLALKLTTIKSDEDYQGLYHILKLYSKEYQTRAAQFHQMQLIYVEDEEDEDDEADEG